MSSRRATSNFNENALDRSTLMKRKDVDRFEKTVAQLEALHSEISVLLKKSPNDALNQFKLTLVNSVVQEANNLLGNTYKPFPDFLTFDQDAVPSNSDVTFILAQYLNCMEKLRSDNIYILHGQWHWRMDDDKTEIRTSAPKKLREK
jgi:hypothetical protein